MKKLKFILIICLVFITKAATSQPLTLETNTVDWIVYNPMGTPASGWQNTWPTTNWVTPNAVTCGTVTINSTAQKLLKPGFTGSTLPPTTNPSTMYLMAKFTITDVNTISTVTNMVLADDDVTIWLNGVQIVSGFTGRGSLIDSRTVNKYLLKCGQNIIAAEVTNTQTGCFFLQNVLTIGKSINSITKNQTLTCQDPCYDYDILNFRPFPATTTYSSTWNDGVSGGQRQFCIPVASSYTLTTLANGCTFTNIINFTQNTSFTYNGVISGPGTVSCADRFIEYKISNPDNMNVTYAWSISPGGPTIYPDDGTVLIDFGYLTSSATYTLTCVVNYNGCVVTKTFTINERCDDLCIATGGLFEKKYSMYNSNNTALQSHPAKQIELQNDDIMTLGVVETQFGVDNHIYLSRATKEGKILWTKTLQNIVPKDCQYFDILEHQNNVYISFDAAGDKSQILKFADDGTFGWRSVITAANGKNSIMRLAKAYNSNGIVDGIIGVGNSLSNINFQYYKSWLSIVKLNLSGTQIWEHTYEHNYNSSSAYSKELEIKDLIYDNTPGAEKYVAIGNINSYSCYVFDHADIFMLSFDIDGQSLYSKYINSSGISNPTGSKFTASSLIKAKTGGYVFTGSLSSSSGSYVIAMKVNTSFGRTWAKGYQANGAEHIYAGRDIEHLANTSGADGYAILTHYTPNASVGPYIYPALIFINDNDGTLRSSLPAKRYYFEVRANYYQSNLILSRNNNYTIMNTASDLTTSNYPYFAHTVVHTDADGNSTCSENINVNVSGITDLFADLDFTEVNPQLSGTSPTFTMGEVFFDDHCCLDDQEFGDPKQKDPCAELTNVNFTVSICDKTITVVSNYTGAGNPSWTFGDGAAAGGVYANYTYSGYGVYTVCFIVTLDNCVKKICKEVVVKIIEKTVPKTICDPALNTISYTPQYVGSHYTFNGTTYNALAPFSLGIGTHKFYGYDINGCLTSIETVVVSRVNPPAPVNCTETIEIPCGTIFHPESFVPNPADCPDCHFNDPGVQVDYTYAGSIPGAQFFEFTYYNPSNCSLCILMLRVNYLAQEIPPIELAIKECVWVNLQTAMPCFSQLPLGSPINITHYSSINPTPEVLHESSVQICCSMVAGYVDHFYEITLPSGCICRLKIRVTCSAGTKTAPGEIKYSLFPNPNNGIFTVIRSGNIITDAADIQITDAYGRVVKNFRMASGEKELQIDLTEFSDGIYFVAVKNKNSSVFMQKVIVSQ